MTPLLDRLIEKGAIGEDGINEAVLLATRKGGTVPLNILRAELMAEEDLLEFIIQEFDIPAVLQFEMEDIPPSVSGAIPRRLAETYRAVPVARAGRKLEVILSDPTDYRAIREIGTISGMEVEARAASESVISWALLRFYEVITPAHAPGEDREATAEDGEEEAGERLSFAVIKVEEEADDGPNIGNWDAPFDLSRPRSGQPSSPPADRRPAKTTRKDAPEVEEDADEGPVLLVDEEDWAGAGSVLEDAIAEEAISTDAPIIRDEPTRAAPVVIMKNVMLGGKQERDIIPPQPMTQRKAVAEILEQRLRPRAVEKPAPAPAEAAAKAPEPARKQKQPMKRLGRIDEKAIGAWIAHVDRLETRDEVLEATLALMDMSFGPSIFLARKGQDLAGWNCSKSFWDSLAGSIHDIVFVKPAPREVWHALERKRGMMGPIAVRAEYPFLEPLIREAKPSILVLPVVVKGIAAGVFLSVLTDSWTASPQLRATLERIGAVLGEQLERFIKQRKQGA